MKRISLWIKSIFGFSQTEVNGFIILIVLMVLLLVAPFFYPYIFKNKPYDHYSIDEKKLQTMLAKAHQVKSDTPSVVVVSKKSNWTRKKNYQTKEYKPFKNQKRTTQKKKIFKKKIIIPIAINQGDTSAFQQIKGIGSKLSQRIIRYRNRLGGFHTISQLKEVYGIDSTLIDTNLKYFVAPDSSLIKRININDATVKEMIAHPYISYKQAIVIINYKQQHGNYHQLTDLNKIHLLKKEEISKLEMYLSFR